MVARGGLCCMMIHQRYSWYPLEGAAIMFGLCSLQYNSMVVWQYGLTTAWQYGAITILSLYPSNLTNLMPVGWKPLSVAEYERYAQHSLPKGEFEYFAGGAGDMLTLRENRQVLFGGM